jgi:sterol desaturase/sphingolipid hydroxylase (fatty acid hydroxylase superfamily)
VVYSGENGSLARYGPTHSVAVAGLRGGWPHTRHIGRLGFLDRWIQTPSNHRVHHAQNDLYLDKNYVGVFLIWDRLFGSFQEELD